LFILIVAIAVRSSCLIRLANVSRGSFVLVTRLLSGRLSAVRSSLLISLSNASRGSSVLVARSLSGRLCAVRSSLLIRLSNVSRGSSVIVDGHHYKCSKAPHCYVMLFSIHCSRLSTVVCIAFTTCHVAVCDVVRVAWYSDVRIVVGRVSFRGGDLI